MMLSENTSTPPVARTRRLKHSSTHEDDNEPPSSSSSSSSLCSFTPVESFTSSLSDWISLSNTQSVCDLRTESGDNCEDVRSVFFRHNLVEMMCRLLSFWDCLCSRPLNFTVFSITLTAVMHHTLVCVYSPSQRCAAGACARAGHAGARGPGAA